jgi:hypothetical protein
LTANEALNGDITTANYDYVAQGVCGSRSDRSALWYRITGTGRTVTIQVCSNNDKPTDFGVFNVCNSQNCKGFPPQAKTAYNCAENKTLDYSFLAEEDTRYFVHVRSDIGLDANLKEGSNFEIIYLEDQDEVPVTTSAAMGLSAMFALGISGFVALL